MTSPTVPKTADTGTEHLVLDVPRDRHGRFDLELGDRAAAVDG